MRTEDLRPETKKAADYCFCDVGSNETEQWVQKHALKILQGESTEVGAGMRRSAMLRDLTQEERKGVDINKSVLMDTPCWIFYQ